MDHAVESLKKMDTFLKELELSGCEVFRWGEKGMGSHPFLSVHSNHLRIGVSQYSDGSFKVDYQPPLVRGTLNKNCGTVEELMDWMSETVRKHG